jgi:hypothetical protein
MENAWVLALICGDRRSFFSEIYRHLENMRFCFRSTPADRIELIQDGGQIKK